jgi:CTP:molybdopterin cytidylyltransferase MocA
MPKIYVVTNRHRIAANRKRPADQHEPVIRVTRGKRGKPIYCDRVVFSGASELLNGLGQPVLPCGASIALVTASPVNLHLGRRLIATLLP